MSKSFFKSRIIIQGDYKIHHGHWLKSLTTDAKGVARLYLSLTYGQEQLVEFDTYIGPHGSSQLDLVLTDRSDSFSVESYYKITGYTLLGLDHKNTRSSTFGGGGVAMHLKNNISFLALSISSNKEVKGESKPIK